MSQHDKIIQNQPTLFRTCTLTITYSHCFTTTHMYHISQMNANLPPCTVKRIRLHTFLSNARHWYSPQTSTYATRFHGVIAPVITLIAAVTPPWRTFVRRFPNRAIAGVNLIIAMQFWIAHEDRGTKTVETWLCKLNGTPIVLTDTTTRRSVQTHEHLRTKSSASPNNCFIRGWPPVSVGRPERAASQGSMS